MRIIIIFYISLFFFLFDIILFIILLFNKIHFQYIQNKKRLLTPQIKKEISKYIIDGNKDHLVTFNKKQYKKIAEQVCLDYLIYVKGETHSLIINLLQAINLQKKYSKNINSIFFKKQALAISQIGLSKDTRFTQILLNKLSHKNSLIRYNTIIALIKIYSSKFLPEIFESLKKYPIRKEKLIETFITIEEDYFDAFKVVLDKSKYDDIYLLCIYTLSAKYDANTIFYIKNMLQTNNDSLILHAFSNLKHFPDLIDNELEQLLLHLTYHSNDELRSNLASTLGILNIKNDLLILHNMLYDENSNVVLNAGNSLLKKEKRGLEVLISELPNLKHNSSLIVNFLLNTWNVYNKPLEI